MMIGGKLPVPGPSGWVGVAEGEGMGVVGVVVETAVEVIVGVPVTGGVVVKVITGVPVTVEV